MNRMTRFKATKLYVCPQDLCNLINEICSGAQLTNCQKANNKVKLLMQLSKSIHHYQPSLILLINDDFKHKYNPIIVVVTVGKHLLFSRKLGSIYMCTPLRVKNWLIDLKLKNKWIYMSDWGNIWKNGWF